MKGVFFYPCKEYLGHVKFFFLLTDYDCQMIETIVVFQMICFLDMTLQKIHCGLDHSVTAGRMCYNLNQNTNESLL